MRLSGSPTAPGEFGSAGVQARWAPARTSGWGWPGSGAPGLARLLVGHGLALDRDGRQGVGERPAAARGAAVGPEHPFVGVGLRVFGADGASHGAHWPALHRVCVINFM